MPYIEITIEGKVLNVIKVFFQFISIIKQFYNSCLT